MMNCNISIPTRTLSAEQIVHGYEDVVLPVFSCYGIEPGKQDTRKTKFHLSWNKLDLDNDGNHIEWKLKFICSTK